MPQLAAVVCQGPRQRRAQPGARPPAERALDQAVVGIEISDVDLAPWEAVLGTTIVARSFEGPIKVRIPPATNPGAQLRVRGHGLPKGRGGERGDLYIVANIQIPPQLTEKEKSLWEELGRTSRFNPRGK